MERAIVYSRVSTDAQERDGTSLDTQDRACLEYTRERGWPVLESIRDAASGFTLDRPGIERLRVLLRQGAVDVVVAYAVDRLSRNQNHIGVLFDEVEQAGARLEFVTEKFEDTAIGRFILAARAFIAEVEREKIAERTMRGKVERARSGRLPQGTGKGCYGYSYDRETGKRAIVPAQANVVSRIYGEFVSRTPIVRIANDLNDEGIPAFGGGNWHSATVYRVLRNETYTGRTIYLRTFRSKTHNNNGRSRPKVNERPPSEWISIEGASPRIIDDDTFQEVKRTLDDPERRRRGRAIYDYGLSGKVRCLICGSAMVGQTLRKRFRYYRCRRAFAGPRADRCPSLYVRADELEQAVKDEAAAVLADPERIITELELLNSNASQCAVAEDLSRRLRGLDDQRQRLLKLYQLGEIDDEYLTRESNGLRQRRESIEAEIKPVPQTIPIPSADELCEASARVREWIEGAQGDDLSLLLNALQIRIKAEKGRGELTGVIPDYAPVCSHADVCPVVA